MGYLDSDLMNILYSMGLKYIMSANDNIGSANKTYANFVYILYYSHEKKDFSFYTNINVHGNNVVGICTGRDKGIDNECQDSKMENYNE